MSWGLAEEAGFAARRLAGCRLPGPEMLLLHLDSLRGRDHRQDFPQVTTSPWRAVSGRLCPVAAAVSLTDRGHDLMNNDPLRLDGIAFPLLMTPQLGLWVRQHRRPVRLRWRGSEVTVLEHGLAINGLSDIACPFAESLVLTVTEDCPATHVPGSDHYPVDAQTWSRVVSLTFETFAPASRQSRDGAGAGMLDND